MTAIEPAPQIMVSRQLAPVEPTQTVAMAQMDAEFRMAQAIARAGDMLPRNYRDKPGAVILVNQWAKAHGVDMLTAMQTVAFVQGRPVIDATMQRALAERAGYAIKIPDATRESATVEVWKDGERVGSATYTWEDATTAKLVGKDNWKNNPEDMLVARATTRAIRRHAPSVMLGMADPDEAYDADPVAVLAPAQNSGEVVAEVEPSADPVADPPAAAVAEAASPDVVDAEVIDDPPAEPEPEAPKMTLKAPKMTLTQLEAKVKAAGKSKAETIQQAQALAANIDGATMPGTLGQILASPEVLPAVVAWLDANTAEAEEPF